MKKSNWLVITIGIIAVFVLFLGLYMHNNRDFLDNETGSILGTSLMAGFVAIFLLLYLKVGAIFLRRGDSIIREERPVAYWIWISIYSLLLCALIILIILQLLKRSHYF